MRVELAAEGIPITDDAQHTFFDKARQKLGVKPVAPPPVYDPDLAADAIIYAAEHPVRDIVVGRCCALITTQRLSPRFLDGALRRVGIQVHLTDQPEPADAADNLFDHVDGHDAVHGSFSDGALRSSPPLLIEHHPVVRWARTASSMLGGIAAPWWPRHPQQRNVRS